MVLLAPLLIWTTWQVQRRIGSPVLFRQMRPGFEGRSFELLKFRTMADARGVDVTAVAGGSDEDVASGLREMGAKYESIRISRAGLNPVEDWHTIQDLRKIFGRLKPHIVLAYTAKPVIYARLALRQQNAAYYTIITGLGYGFGRESLKQRAVGQIMQALYRRALKHCAGILFQNPDDRSLFLERRIVADASKVHLINGSGVNLERFQPVPLPAKPVFQLVARLIVEKGVRDYVAAARLVRQKHPAARFLLVGATDANPNCVSDEELAAWQREGVVEYLGRLDDVRPAYALASVYVLPSFYREGTPRTVLEAMAMGRPVITTDAPGCRETVMDGVNGFLVPVKNATALADAMEKFIENPTLVASMGQESLRIAREKYDVRKVNAAILGAMGL